MPQKQADIINIGAGGRGESQELKNNAGSRSSNSIFILLYY